MKNSYNTLFKVAFLIICFLVIQRSTAQLVAGDIAFTGYHSTSNTPQSDGFSIIILKNVSDNTVCYTLHRKCMG
jgi:hypothetical protein